VRFLFVSPPHAGFDRNIKPQPTFTVSRIPCISGIVLASYLRKFGHKCYVVDGNRITHQFGKIRHLTYKEMWRQATKFNPDIIGVTMLTADFYECKKTIEIFRQTFPKALIVAGGPHASGDPTSTLTQIPELDGVGIGPGEEICLDLADGNKHISEIEGYAYMDGGEVFFNKKRYIGEDIDKFPFPAWDLIDGHYYSELNYETAFGLLTRSLPVLTSRGCPHACYFCSSRWNQPLRRHSARYVVNLCKHLVETYPINTVAFWDDSIGIIRKHLERICELFIESGLNKRVNWICQLRATHVEANLLSLMKEAGCVKIHFGAESGTNRILKVLRKNTTLSQNVKAADMILDSGIGLGLSVMVGCPTETEGEMRRTIDFCECYPEAHIGIGRFCPLPGSPAYKEFVEKGILNPETVNWELLGNFSEAKGPYFGGAMPKQRFQKFLRSAQRHFWKRNMDNLVRRYKNEYSEILQLCYPKPSVPKRLFKKTLPISIQNIVKKAVSYVI